MLAPGLFTRCANGWMPGLPVDLCRVQNMSGSTLERGEMLLGNRQKSALAAASLPPAAHWSSELHSKSENRCQQRERLLENAEYALRALGGQAFPSSDFGTVYSSL